MSVFSDNLISYNAGPINIILDAIDRKIIIKTTFEWLVLIPDFLKTIKEAWELSDEEIIKVNDTTFEIKYNFKTLNLYLEKSIITT